MVYTLAPSHHIFHSYFPITHPINLLHSPHHHNHHRRRLSHITIRSSHLSTGIFHSHSALDQHRFNNQNPQIPDNSNDYDVDVGRDNTLLDRIYNSSSVNLNRTPTEIGIEEDTDGDKGESCSGIFTNMWWANLKAAVGQRINMQGILFSVSVIVRNRQWMIPHVSVQDVRCIDWAALKRMGFEGVVFDKDNTLTVPYSLSLWGPLVSSVESCKAVFGNNIAVFSNSAGLQEYDPDGRKARAIEFAIGIRVIRHKMKKPAGSAEEIERYFGCDSSKLIMVGDRPFTDIVYGNRNGCLTILTAPLSLAEETFIVKQVRKIELALLKWLLKRGLKPVNPRLVSEALDCVKEPPHV